jgi:hypothetical protein
MESNKQNKKSYSVQVRKKGVFTEIGKTETAEKGFIMGKANVLNTARASLKVVPISEPNENLNPIAQRILNNRVFAPSKREPGVFIQKRGFRISSPGEKRDITYKGIMAQKKKKSIFSLGR